MRILFIIILSAFFGINSFAQRDSSLFIKHTPEFRFEDGIFLNFEQVKDNSPIAISRIISTLNSDDIDFFNNLIEEKEISYPDFLGAKQEVNTSEIWGYSNRGVLYINFSGEFNRIPIVGNACHFVADITVYREQFHAPFYSPYYYPTFPSSYPSREMHQYLLDFGTGKVMEYNRQNLAVILMRDTTLYEEYNTLKKRQQKKLKFLYLRKYNERNPLYLPANNY